MVDGIITTQRSFMLHCFGDIEYTGKRVTNIQN